MAAPNAADALYRRDAKQALLGEFPRLDAKEIESMRKKLDKYVGGLPDDWNTEKVLEGLIMPDYASERPIRL